jgi:hypothetical protein
MVPFKSLAISSFTYLFGQQNVKVGIGNVVDNHSYDILGARMLWKPKEARILKNFIDQPV